MKWAGDLCPDTNCEALSYELDTTSAAGHFRGSHAESQRFYCKARVATEIQGLLTRSIFQHDDQLLAQQERNGLATHFLLLTTDQQRSVLGTVNTPLPHSIVYSPYGHTSVSNGLLSLLAFNGECRDSVTGSYVLGNGYRAFNPVLMRFNSPDSWSPFGRGGINCYAYCSGNPIGRKDPNGRYWEPLMKILHKPLKRLTRGAQSPAVMGRGLKKNMIKPAAKPELLKNTREKSFPDELKHFQKALENDPFEVINVTSAQDLSHLGGGMARRFVLTKDRQMLIDPSIDLERRGINHAILASYGGSESGVMAAGTISANSRRATIWRDSGHYKPGASAMEPVKTFLNSLGVEVECVRMLFN